jgi:hypothetical protein
MATEEEEEEEEVNGSRQLPRPITKHRTAWYQSLVQLQAAFAEFAEDGKYVKWLLARLNSTFLKETVAISTIQTPYGGEGGPWKRHGDSATHIAAMEAQNTNKQSSFMQVFGPNKRPADPIANMGSKKRTANLCGGLVPEPHRKHKWISMYHTYCIMGPNAT